MARRLIMAIQQPTAVAVARPVHPMLTMKKLEPAALHASSEGQ